MYTIRVGTLRPPNRMKATINITVYNMQRKHTFPNRQGHTDIHKTSKQIYIKNTCTKSHVIPYYVIHYVIIR